MEEINKQLKIKSGTVKRLRKELHMYEKEQEVEKAKVEKLKADGADIHDIRYAENILAESVAMIPDTRQRLQSGLEELRQLLEEHATAAGESDEYKQAKEEEAFTAPLFE